MDLKKYLQKPTLLIVAIIVVMGLAGFGIAFGLSQKNNKTAASACPQGETCISLLGKTASPDVITIQPGTFVRFNSADGGKHSIALEHAAAQHNDDSEYHSGEFAKDEAWRVQFKKDGTYTFRDELNPDVKINVIVYTEGKDYKVQ
jgi:plastocyanin